MSTIGLTETQSDILANIVQERRTELLEKWNTEQCIQDVLTEKGIAQEYFVKHFGSLILEHFIGQLRGENPPGISSDEMPMMTFFARHAMVNNDAEKICLKKKNTFIDLLQENGINHSDVMFKPAVELFDFCFSSVLDKFMEDIRDNDPVSEQYDVDRKQIAIIKEHFHQAADEEQLEIIQKHKEESMEDGQSAVVPVKDDKPAQEGPAYNYDNDDLQRLLMLEKEIVFLSKGLSTGTDTQAGVDKLSQKLNSFATTVLLNPTFNAMGEQCKNLALLLSDKTNSRKIQDDLQTFSLYMFCLNNSLVAWRKSLSVTEEDCSHYYEPPIISNIKTIVQFLQSDG